MNVRERIASFLANGPQRREWLDSTLNDGLDYYLGPTGIPDRLRAVGMMNPVNDMGEAMGAARDGRYGDAAMHTAIAAAPAVGGAVAGRMAPGFADDAVAAVSDTLTGFGMMGQGAADAGRRFAADEYGGTGTRPGSPNDFEYLGYRTVDSGTDPIRPSRVWADGEPTNDILDGVSVTETGFSGAKSMHGLAPPKRGLDYYIGEETYLIGGNKASYGEDPGELVIRDPVVLSQVVRKYGIAGAAAMLGMTAAEVEAALPDAEAAQREQQAAAIRQYLERVE